MQNDKQVCQYFSHILTFLLKQDGRYIIYFYYLSIWYVILLANNQIKPLNLYLLEDLII